ncbi:MAG: hypothetical protein ACKVOY_05375 [Burkholderiaceae bacterium]
MNQSFLQKISESFKRKIYDFEDYVFEKRHSIELSGIVPGKDLSAENINSLQHATAYHAVWCRNLRALFSEVEKLDIRMKISSILDPEKERRAFMQTQKTNLIKLLELNFQNHWLK